MELMEIIEVFLLTFFSLTVVVLVISFTIYKMKKKGASAEIITQPQFEYAVLKPQQAFPGRLEMNNAIILEKYKKEQERFTAVRTKSAKPIIYTKLPQKYKVINNKYSETAKQQANFRVNYSTYEPATEHSSTKA